MTRDEALRLLCGGRDSVAEWNRRREAGEQIPEFSHANLIRANLSEANLFRANLSDGNLSGANLIRANLRRAKLSGADLSSADLSDADLSRAKLGGAMLTHADLSGADLSDADFADVFFDHSRLGDVELSEARGLADAKFLGPSTIGVDTLVKSKGRIPDSFLRGCGFAPWQVLDAKLYNPDLTPGQIADLQTEIFNLRTEAYPWVGGVFISYAHEDSAPVDKIRDRLDAAGIPTWLDRHDLTAGPVEKQVQRAIRFNDVVLLVLSEASIESDWVEHELEMARKKETEEGRDVLCPVALDGAWKAKVLGEPDVLWRQVKKKHVLDFSKWKTKAFEPTFEKLLTGLKTWYARPASGVVKPA